MTVSPSAERLPLTQTKFDRLTHYLFRYPAKFHPPVARALLERYTKPGDHVLDPFCGSGSLLVECAVMGGRHGTGSDVDPVAVFVSQNKIRRLEVEQLSRSCTLLADKLEGLRRPDDEYLERRFSDLSSEEMHRVVSEEGLWVPAIPNLLHWFRVYVILDLARIYQEISRLTVPTLHRDFLMLCFASIVRSASNADPVPVSGLEVTSHMKRKDEQGRLVDPFSLLLKAIKKALSAVGRFYSAADPSARVSAITADATEVASYVGEPVDVVITSPPYHNAVDYYRRHQLEMFWLGLTKSHEERLALLPRYIGRHKVPQSHPFVATEESFTPLAGEWELRMRQVSEERANAFKHYQVAMGRSLREIEKVLPVGGLAVFVVGHSTWNSSEIPTADLFAELAKPRLRLIKRLWYPVVNRYMSYSRRNGANIDKEYVLVFERVL